MDTYILTFTIIGALGGLGSLGCFIIAIKDIKKVARSLSNEMLFGVEAQERFHEIKSKLKKSQHWGPCLWEGGQDVHNMLEIKNISYDPNTMGTEWKDCKQFVKRVYVTESGETLVEGWRLK